jgi:hypothetical protein
VNYVSVEALKYACEVLRATREAQEQGLDPTLGCGWQPDPGVAPCGKPAEYLVPDGTRASASGDIEAAPQWFCRRHLELELGEPVREQPIFRRIERR